MASVNPAELALSMQLVSTQSHSSERGWCFRACSQAFRIF